MELPFTDILDLKDYEAKLEEGTYKRKDINERIVTFNYDTMSTNKFKNKHLIDCRGIAFDKKTGKLLTRGIHKFFNLGENAISSQEKFDALMKKEDPVLLEKLDGSMVTPLLLDGKVLFKMKKILCKIYENDSVCFKLDGYEGRPNYEEYIKSQSKKEKKSNKFEKERKKIEELVRYCFKNNWIVIFEYCGPENVICVEYEKEEMFIIAIREFDTGRYLNWSKVEQISKQFGFRCSKRLKGKLEDVMKPKNFEGVVTFFEKSQMFFKIKTEWYRMRHRLAPIAGSKEKKKNFFINKILENKIDDVLPILEPSEKEYVEELKQMIIETGNKVFERTNKFLEKNKELSNKEISFLIDSKYKSFRALVFRMKKKQIKKTDSRTLYNYKESVENYFKETETPLENENPKNEEVGWMSYCSIL